MNLELAYQDYGEGPALIIVHGLLGSARNWRTVAQQLGEMFHVYVIELRNHGDSPWHESMDYPAMADDIRAFIVSHRLDQPLVMGHSMGGKAVMTLALNYPDSLSRLIVVDIAPVSYTDSFSGYLEALQALELEGHSRAQIDNALRAAIPQPAIRGFLLQNLVATGPQQYRWRVNLAALAANISAIAGFPDTFATPCYPGPAQFIYGANSDYLQPRHRASIDRLFPNAEIEIISDAGHWVHADQPQRFIDSVKKHR